MKLFSLLLLSLPSLTFAAAQKGPLPHILPDAPSSAYVELAPRLLGRTPDGLDNVVEIGTRNLEWLNHINSLRPAGSKLSLTSKESQRAIPIDAPMEYNPSLIQGRLDKLRSDLPREFEEVIFGHGPFPDQPTLAEADYLKWSRDLDRVYQSALRWRMMQDWLNALADRRHHDMRGWYFLSRLEGRAEKLRNFSGLEKAEQEKLRNWLVGLCFNGSEADEIAVCQMDVDGRISKGEDLEAYFQREAPAAQELFNSYFTIPQGASRPEVHWNESHDRILAPFSDPGSAEVGSFLTVNIQDEWHFGPWQLELPLAPPADDLPHVVFLPDVTPHVNGLGGNEITMNSKQPLTEYDAQWTIRHEYGHVLGFPDCYVEFYEKERDVIVNYQFDATNLMCSRKGHIQEQHGAELLRVYRVKK